MGERLGPQPELIVVDAGQRLFNVYERLAPKMTHGRSARSIVDRWHLRFETLKDGTLSSSMYYLSKEGELHMRIFVYNDWFPDQPNTWIPMNRSVTPENFTEYLNDLADFAERAEWQTTY